MTKRYLPWSALLKEVWGKRVQKISLDIGAGCPHRNGLQMGGCVFCDSFGGGSGAFLSGIGLEEQISQGYERLKRRYKTDTALLYFQSYSTTNLPLQDLVEIIERALVFSERFGKVAGLAIGARPDQIEDELLRFLNDLAKRKYEIWLELGIQTTDPSGLEWLNRGHGLWSIEDTLERTRRYRSLLICAHLIAGIPGEKHDQLALSVEWLCKRGINGIKFHPLYVLSGTPLEKLFRENRFTPLGREEYAQKVVEALRRLHPEVAIQRLTADASFPRLIAPEWVSDKRTVINEIENLLDRLDARQGDYWAKPHIARH